MLTVFHYKTFDEFSIPTREQLSHAGAAVVFTGAYSRIDVGLRLRAGNLVSRLYITGFNQKSGIFPHFVEMYSRRNPDIKNIDELMRCCVEVGVWARSTYQNALETRCWIQSELIDGPILLVTSRNHMARALADLRGKLPFRTIIPYPIFDLPPKVGSERMIAFLQYIASLIASRLPQMFDPRDAGAFSSECPRGPTRMSSD